MADNQDIVELVKERNPIEDVIEADGFKVPKRGRYRKAPGHGGLVIDVQLQTYHWNGKGEWGDVIAWVQRQRKMDFKGAVEWLARRANLPDPSWGGVDKSVRIAARIREEALDVAHKMFVRWFWRSPEAQDYAMGRGWTMRDQTPDDEQGGEVVGGTAQHAMLGYSGEGTEQDRAEMRAEMTAAGVDVNSPAAVSILGMRGNVQAWSREHGVQLNEDWVLNGYIPGMVGRKRLVYPHVRNGRIHYLSGRSIVEKMHYNLPEALIGKRQVYLNHVYTPGCDQVVVVEGQADAVTLAQVGVGAVALAGVAPGDVGELLKRHKVVYIGLDADQGGRANAWKVADQMGAMTRIILWPELPWTDKNGNVNTVKDANDLLRAEGEQAGALVRRCMETARTYVEEVALWAGGQQGAARDEAMKRALAIICTLSELELAQYRKPLARALQVDVREMTNMVKKFGETAAKDARGGEPMYTWGGYIQGYLVEYLYDQENHTASLAWRDPDGGLGSGRYVEIEGQRYEAFEPVESLANGAVIFPSRLGEHKTIRELLAYIEAYLKAAYLMPNDKMSRLMAYYVLLTWLYDSFETVIYLRAMGSAGSGKSEFMRRIGLICYRMMTANGAGSTSSLFRALERYRGTVFIDEADIQNSDSENDMVKFYNLGAMRNNPIWRTIEVTDANGQKNWEAVSFQTFCPKLVAMRKEFRDDAVGSRSLTFKFQSREMAELKAAGIPLAITAQMRERAGAIRNLLVRWRLETWRPEIEVDMEAYDLTISPRLNQVAGPLLAIAADDPEQQEEIRKNLREYYAETILSKSMTITARVIEALWKIWKYPDLHRQLVKAEPDGTHLVKIGDVTRITNELIDEMNETDDGDADEEKKNRREQQGVKPHRVGRILREELQLQVTERRRDGFWVIWNEPRITGLSTRYGVNPESVGPDVTRTPIEGPKQEGSQNVKEVKLL